ncbi:transposase [Dyadobacter sp. CY261]|uniref:transposase n=1 Tax=Dyadobacter sp. CY261 TaxID=2907203 RepID=UPI001F3279B7|nr:transposase [Dyadobacter sp. CY261]MCF0075383.1 transposase [Dyadobacter sp. CY261]
MRKQRRTFSAEDRYSIVQESLRSGPSEVSRKYSLSPSLLRRWKEKYLASGKDGLRDSYPRVDLQVRILEPGRRSGRKRTLEAHSSQASSRTRGKK